MIDVTLYNPTYIINFDVYNLFQDFSDWQPSSSFDTAAKRPKRGNEEKEEMRRSSKGNNTALDASPAVTLMIILNIVKNM